MTAKQSFFGKGIGALDDVLKGVGNTLVRTKGNIATNLITKLGALPVGIVAGTLQGIVKTAQGIAKNFIVFIEVVSFGSIL